MAILATTIASAAKAAIATNPNFNGVTPELSALIDALSDGVANAVNAEVGAMKAVYNVHVHPGIGVPPAVPMV